MLEAFSGIKGLSSMTMPRPNPEVSFPALFWSRVGVGSEAALNAASFAMRELSSLLTT